MNIFPANEVQFCFLQFSSARKKIQDFCERHFTYSIHIRRYFFLFPENRNLYFSLPSFKTFHRQKWNGNLLKAFLEELTLRFYFSPLLFMHSFFFKSRDPNFVAKGKRILSALNLARHVCAEQREREREKKDEIDRLAEQRRYIIPRFNQRKRVSIALDPKIQLFQLSFLRTSSIDSIEYRIFRVP